MVWDWFNRKRERHLPPPSAMDELRGCHDFLRSVDLLISEEKGLIGKSLCKEESELLWGYYYGLIFCGIMLTGCNADSFTSGIDGPELRKWLLELHKDRRARGRDDNI